ncbi:hypothetical protein SAMN02949497_1638 [Methylomagnum ishizawai]|uniref:DUF2752 domain-containing protein n=1 Tax=Methylomagnum ishizawai TaxID=1760988 RepID=A0A1Y6CUM0_9GAMM|nr:hypothetical protein [Methylomagnum ishizawai]SMF94328.1 hypothetical protein SAMN02949497_1638 [Methylomagnum ishizawai]
MRLRCPCCGAEMSLDTLMALDAARDAVERALRLAPIGKPILMYLGLFRPAKRSLTLERVAKLLEDLLPMIEAAEIKWEGQVYAAPREAWAGGIDTLVQMRAEGKLDLPLDNHNLLRSIIVRRIRQANLKAEAQAEAQEEQRRQALPRDRAQSAPAPALPLGMMVDDRGQVVSVLEHHQRLRETQPAPPAAPAPSPTSAPLPPGMMLDPDTGGPVQIGAYLAATQARLRGVSYSASPSPPSASSDSPPPDGSPTDEPGDAAAGEPPEPTGD